MANDASSCRIGIRFGCLVFLGNLIDRINNGYVVDFMDVYYHDSHWPAFNVADSAITCGVILLLIDGLILATAKKAEANN